MKTKQEWIALAKETAVEAKKKIPWGNENDLALAILATQCVEFEKIFELMNGTLETSNAKLKKL